MGNQRILGIVLLLVGVAVLIYGINASHSIADRVSDTFTGRFTEATTWYIIGGAASGLLGLLLVAFGGGLWRDGAHAHAEPLRTHRPVAQPSLVGGDA